MRTQMSFAKRRPSRRAARGAAVTLIVVLAMAATALAAHPKAGSHFSGFTAASPVNGFKAPVTFTVSGHDNTLLNFKYSSFGCFGAGGFQPGVDYYTKPGSIIKVGTVKLSKSGRFSVTGAVSDYTAFGTKTKTTSKVTGTFTSAKAASGTVTFSQKLSGKYTSACGPASLPFSVTSH